MASTADFLIQGLLHGTGLGRTPADFAQQNQQLQLGEQQLQFGQAKLDAAAAETQQKARYDAAAQDYFAKPDPRKLVALATMFPEQAKALGDVWKIKDDAQRQADTTWFSSIENAAKNGRKDLALIQLKNRLQADRAYGADISELEAVTEDLEADADGALNFVRGYALAHLRAADPGNFDKNYGERADEYASTSDGAIYSQRSGAVTREAPTKYFKASPEDNVFAIPGNGGRAGGAAAGGSIIDQMLPITLGSESGNRDYAPGGGVLTSSAGAQGRMQVMPGTQVDPGFGVTPARDASVEEKARVGRDYLGAMMQKYGDPAKAWAAYNAGPGRVDEAIAAGGNWLSKLPAETRAYVTKNMGQLRRGDDATPANGPALVQRGITPPKSKASRMSQDEVVGEGLDPALVWYRKADGTPVSVKNSKAAEPSGAYSQSALDAFDRAIDTAKRLKSHPGLEAGVGAPTFSWNPARLFGAGDGNVAGYIVPGSKAADFRAELNAMKAQVFLPMVQSMKGMGSLSNAEGDKLTAAIGALDTSQSEEQFKASLDRIVEDLTTYKQRGMSGQSSSGTRDGPVRVKTPQEAAKLPVGTLYIAPDGKTRKR